MSPEAVAPAPRPGPQRSLPATPARAPGSARRTTSLDMSRPDGPLGRVRTDVRGQDVRTDGAGRGRVVARVGLTLDIDQRTGTIEAVTPVEGVEGAAGALDTLVGASVRSGFGRRLADTFPADAARRSLLYSALEDLGGGFLVAGYDLLRTGGIPADRALGEARARAQADVCVGWATGSPLLATLQVNGQSALPYGPAAPVIEGDDPLGWHPMAPLATGTVRRRRRLDVAPGAAAGDALAVHSHFRDSYAAPEDEGGEMVMHEYVVHAGVDGEGRLGRVAVEPRVLPWRECPGAVASAQRLVGVPVAEVAARARRELIGPTTCTHLTSTLRCLADLVALPPAAMIPT